MIMKVKYKRLTIRQLIHNWINRKMGIEEIRYHISECSLEMSSINWRSSYDWNTGIYYCIYHCHLSRGNLNIYFDALVRCNATYAFNGGGRHVEYIPTEYGVAEVNASIALCEIERSQIWKKLQVHSPAIWNRALFDKYW